MRTSKVRLARTWSPVYGKTFALSPSVPLQGRASVQAEALLLLSLMCPVGYVPTIPEPEEPWVCSPHLLHVTSLSTTVMKSVQAVSPHSPLILTKGPLGSYFLWIRKAFVMLAPEHDQREKKGQSWE